MQISLIQARENFMWNEIKEPLIRGKTGRKEVIILLFIAETFGENYYVLDNSAWPWEHKDLDKEPLPPLVESQ